MCVCVCVRACVCVCVRPAILGLVPQHLFKHSICKATHWTETFIATDSEPHCCLMFVCLLFVLLFVLLLFLFSFVYLRCSPLHTEWLPGLNIVGRKPVNHAITEPLAPVLIER